MHDRARVGESERRKREGSEAGGSRGLAFGAAFGADSSYYLEAHSGIHLIITQGGSALPCLTLLCHALALPSLLSATGALPDPKTLLQRAI